MTDLDTQFEELIAEFNATKAENGQLKAQVNSLLKACQLYGDSVDNDDLGLANEADTIVLMIPEQCLNSVKADAIQEMFDKMPLPFNKLRDQGNWMVDYERELRGNNGQ